MGLFFETSFMEWLSVFIILCTSLWFYFKSKYNFWKTKGVRYITPVIPFGNIRDMVLLRKSSANVVKEFYDAFPEERFVGLYEAMNPLILIRDPELIKHVMVKDFSHFQDRGLQSREELGPLNAHLFNLTGKRWRSLRTRLTPTFTSGKMKMMFDLMTVCAHQLKEYLEKAAQNNEMLEMKEIMAKFTTDVIGLCAFGLQSNAISDSDSEFRQMGRQIFLSSPIAAAKGILELIFPSLMRILHINTFPDKVSNFFIRTVKDVIEYREKNNVSRNDFMQLIIELKNKGNVQDDEAAKSEDVLDDTPYNASENNIEFTDNLLASQAFIFFVAGFETSSSALSFCLHELSVNPEIQEQLRNEIDSTLGKCKGKITYDAIQSMSYIDQVLAETLRKYPPLPAVFRVVTKPYVIPGTSVHLDVGMKVMIPVYGLHNDPKYFPEPEIFDPENFSDERKAKRPNNIYLPFGDGPRNCIGMRFGLLQAKLGLIFLLSNFKFNVGDKTQLPLELDPKVLLTASKSGIWLKIKKRTNT